MTNADIIRSMTDEQLYEFLSCWEQKERGMTDIIKICDVVECEDCPRYADDCDGEAEDE